MGTKVPAPCVVFSDIPLQQCHQHLVLLAHEGDNLGLSWHECGWDHSLCFVVFRQSGYCLNVLLLGCPFPGHLAERAAFSWGFVSASGCFWVAFSPVSSLGYVGQEENLENSPPHCSLSARTDRGSLSSLSFQSSYVCFVCSVCMCTLPRVFRCTYEEQGKVYLHHLPRSLHSVAECFTRMNYFPV